MEPQVSRDERLTVIESILFQNPDGVRVVELADMCGVDRRTIYRDIAKLRSSGVPIYQTRGRFCVSREHYNANVSLSLNETIALFTTVRVMSQLAEQQNPHAISALSKLSAGLPEGMGEHVEHVARLLRQKPVDRLHSRVTDLLVRAWSGQRWTRIWTVQGEQAVELALYFLEATQHGQVYAVGLDASSQRIRAFRLDQIVRAELLNRTYQRAKTFSPENYLADITGTLRDDQTGKHHVRLVFTVEVGRMILANRPATATQITRRDDRRVELSMRVEDWRNLIPWIRSFGADVEVLQPKALRTAISEEARRITRLYDETEQNPQIT